MGTLKKTKESSPRKRVRDYDLAAENLMRDWYARESMTVVQRELGYDAVRISFKAVLCGGFYKKRKKNMPFTIVLGDVLTLSCGSLWLVRFLVVGKTLCSPSDIW